MPHTFERHGKWLVVLSVMILIITWILFVEYLVDKKQNYNELWRKVNALEREVFK